MSDRTRSELITVFTMAHSMISAKICTFSGKAAGGLRSGEEEFQLDFELQLKVLW